MFNSYFTVAVLCIINMINYMDRFTIAGVLREIQEYFEISAATSGLLQTAFITSYMIFAPVFGFLGDRYSRKNIIIFGVFFWSTTTLISSFVQKHHTILFFFFRALVGIGEASYATVAPTIIADLFVDKKRSIMLAIFYFAIPVGSGLGYIVGISMSQIFGHWKWALRFTPIFGFVSVICFFFVKEPNRGEIEQNRSEIQTATPTSSNGSFADTIRSLKKDILYLKSVPSFVHTTLGFTCVCFSIGALSWWSPYFMQHAIVGSTEEGVGFIFGVIACAGGFLGVLIGSSSSRYFRLISPKADPLICACGVFCSIPCVFISVTIARSYPLVAWITIFLAITFLSTNWSIVVDILLCVIVPNRRSTAQAIQILTSHLLGDAISPFLIGLISDVISQNDADDDIRYRSLFYALYLTPFVLIFGGIFFALSARTLLMDVYNCKNLMAGSDPTLSSDDIIQIAEESESTNNLLNNSSLHQRNVEYDDSSNPVA